MTRVKNVASAIGLLALVLAIPAALWFLVGSPIPHDLSPRALTHALTSRDDGGNLVHVITWIAWIAWAYFAIAVILETISQLREARHEAPLQVPGFTHGRSAIAPLVSLALGLAITAGSTAMPAMAAGPSAPPSSVSATTAPTSTPSAAHSSSPQPSAPTAAPAADTATTGADHEMVYTVTHHGEALWSIAEHFYGHGTDWKKIAAANSAVTGPDGARILQVGDKLTIPGIPAAAAADAGFVTHTVTSTDTLRGLAAEHLGSASRWHEIYEASRGITQPDGKHLTDPDVILDGWTLHIPTTASQHPAATAPADAGFVTHTVTSTDTLRGLAAEHLGSASRWHEIYEASRGITQPDGKHVTDPDIILDGWTLHIPTTQQPSSHSANTSPSAQSPAGPAQPATHAPVAPGTAAAPQTTPVTGPDTNAAPAPAAPATAAVVPTTAPTAATQAPSVSATADPQAPAAAASSLVIPTAPAAVPAPALETKPTTAASPQMQTSAESPAPTVAAVNEQSSGVPRGIEDIGGVLAVCLLGILGFRWRQQAMRRRPGQRVPALSEPQSATVSALQQTTTPALKLEHLDIALRALSEALDAQDRLLPPLLAVRVADQRIDMILAEDSPAPPPPFLASATSGRIWSYLPDQYPLPDKVTASAPYPALVTLGRDEDQAHILVDLETLGALAITDEHPDQIIAAMATEMALNTWADDLTITLVGTCETLPSSLGVDRLSYVPNMEQLIVRLEHDAAASAESLTTEGLAAARDGRTSADTDQWTPHVVLVGTAIDDDTAQRLGKILTDQPRVSIAAVTTDDRKLSAWTLISHGDAAHATLDPLGLAITPQRLTDSIYTTICQVSEHSLATSTEPASWWNHDPQATRPDEDEPELTAITDPVPLHTSQTSREDELAGESTDDEDAPVVHLHQPTIRLLGEVRMENVTGDLTKGRAATEVMEPIVYVHLHPGDLTANFRAALEAHTRDANGLASRARRYMGYTSDGEKLFPDAARTDRGRTYTLHPSVTSDWEQLQQLIGDGINTAPSKNLWRALDLVEGRPLASITPGQWPWIETTRTLMIDLLLDLAHEVADRALAQGDTSRATWAIEKGHMIDPLWETIDRDELRLHRMTGNATAMQHVIERITKNCREIRMDPAPETLSLIHSITDAQRHRARA